MRIHTVKEGDTVFKIARKYATSPMKIIENNGLLTPDRLSVGRELLILIPTRTYTVRGGDTLKKISERFGVDTEELQRANPYLAGGDRIYHGELISVKRDAKKYGVSTAVGYYYKGCPEDKLTAAMPYLTHVALSAIKRSRGEMLELFDARGIADKVKASGKYPSSGYMTIRHQGKNLMQNILKKQLKKQKDAEPLALLSLLTSL